MLVGMIIGVGIFGVPYVLSRAGLVPGIFYFIVLGAAIILVHLFYGEAVLRTNGRHRLVGYAEKYLGMWGRRAAAGTSNSSRARARSSSSKLPMAAPNPASAVKAAG